MRKLIVAAEAALMLISVIAGIICKQSFTDIDKYDEPFKNFNVGLMSETTAENTGDFIDNDLEEQSMYILKVTPTGKLKLSFLCYTEPVKVLNVYKGDNISSGDEIEILRASSCIYWNMGNKNAVNMGFVNFMNQGEDYLVFLSKKIPDKKVYYTTQCFIAPIFSYSERSNVILNSSNSTALETKYGLTGNNEFLVSDEISKKILEEKKNELIKRYS